MYSHKIHTQGDENEFFSFKNAMHWSIKWFLSVAPRKKKSKKKGLPDDESPSHVGGRCLSPFQKRRQMKQQQQQQQDSSSSTDEDEDNESGMFVSNILLTILFSLPSKIFIQTEVSDWAVVLAIKWYL